MTSPLAATVSQTLIDACLLLGVAASWLGAAALLRFTSPYDRLHLPGYVVVVAGFFIAMAVIISDPVSAQALKTVVIYVALVSTSAILTHAIGRMLRIREESQDTR